MRGWRSGWGAIALITVGAGALRVIDLGAVRVDPFYDAAVRSMGLSWHNFFFGAFEPGGRLAIDKPPIDLWLQVASVKLLGFGSTALKLPEALAGTLSVPLVAGAVRRPFGAGAGVAAAGAMAVMPIEVITARSDTMDAVMMALLAGALLAGVRGCEGGGKAWLLGGAVALGLAFNVKLLESLVALPGLGLLVLLGLPRGAGGSRRLRRPGLLALAGAVYVAVALSWLSATLLFPAHERPFAIGSTNGSAWNAAFVFNGTDRLTGKTVEGSGPAFEAGRRYPEATQTQRDAIPITPPSATRMLVRVGPLPAQRLGWQVLAAILLGGPALLLAIRGAPPSERDEEDKKEEEGRRQRPDRARVRRALAVCLAVWMVCGIVLFSAMARLHPRYVEAFTPAVAAVFGIGVAWVGSFSSRGRLLTAAVALGALTVYADHLVYGRIAIWWLTAACALGTVALGVLALAAARAGWRGRGLLAGSAVAGLLIATLAIPLRASIEAVESRLSDAGQVGALHPGVVEQLSAYLRTHQRGARYEVAADSATKIASLIVRDARPVLVLTTYQARTLTDALELARLAGRGEVRYAFLDGTCDRHTPPTSADCSPPAQWVRAHARDVSRAAHLPRAGMLWELPGASVGTG
ncbi:MAG: glycosyltransferase family 39 protein [Solirubrobacterales bacterium]|nr:glycosyltransferase family 39 protein [Solirubrobacterales bacterium]